MSVVSRLEALWRNLLRRDRVERDLDGELRALVELLVDEKIRAGLPPDEARREAALELGPVAAIKDQVRDVRHGAFLDTLFQDLRYAARGLRRSPLFAATATVSLAMGIGATTSIFTLANGLLLRAAAGVTEADRLVDVVRRERDRGPGIAEISYPTLRDIRERARSFEAVYGWRLQPSSVSLRVGDGTAEHAFAEVVTTNFFGALAVRAAVGRVLDASDSEAPDASPVIVLSHAFWNRRFQADPGVVGQVVRINGRPLTIAGVAAASFRGLGVTAPDLWMPVSLAGLALPDTGSRVLQDRGMPLLMLGARLKPDASRRQASEEIAAIGAALQREFPSTEARTAPPLPGARSPGTGFVWSVETASPIPYGLRPLAAGFLGLLMALVSTVLAIACANLAGILLARAVTRRQEMAVRAALGGGRVRLIRQLLTETLLLFTIGGAAGLLLARGIIHVLMWLLPAFPVPVNLSAPLDGRVVAFALGLSFVAAVLSGLTPALHASRADVVSALKDDAQGPVNRLRLRQVFVVAQIAFSVLLVVVAALLVRGFDRQVSTMHGFDPTGVGMAAIDLSQAGYTSSTGPAFARRILDAVRSLPGVEAASLADHPPEPGSRSFGSLSVPGAPEAQARASFNWTAVTPQYFTTVRIPVLMGRAFTDADLGSSEPSMILGETAAARLFGRSADAVGRHVTVRSNLIGRDGRESSPTQARVIGVVGDVQFGRTAPLAVYVPWSHRYTPAFTIVARWRTPEASRAALLREVVSTLDPNLPVLSAGSLENHASGPVETQLRVGAAVAASVALVGLWLAGIGVYGVTAYGVAQRTREIGIRLSLGATGGQVAWMAMEQGVRLAAGGTGLGLLFALLAGRLLAGGQFGLPAYDPVALLIAMLLFALVCLAACAIPVRRATRINALEALRYE